MTKITRYKGHERSWSDPDVSLLDDRRPNLPAFPLGHIVHATLRDVLMREVDASSITLDQVVHPFLGVASTLIGNQRIVRAGPRFKQPCTLWTALVGKSGDRKTDAVDISDHALIAASDTTGLRLYTNDSTVERLKELLKKRPSGMLMLQDELTGWFQHMTRYSNDRPFWLKDCATHCNPFYCDFNPKITCIPVG
jgi:hypothetical protein